MLNKTAEPTARHPVAAPPAASARPARTTRDFATNSGSKIILICGGSCSGKTTLALGLTNELQRHGTAELLSMDNYYHDLSDQGEDMADSRNFDHPDAANIGLLQEHLRQLSSGNPVPKQLYDFKTHHITRLEEMISPADFILVEGIFTLHFKALRDQADAAIFIHADADLRLARRVVRDTSARRLPLQLVIRQYLEDVRPMHEKFIAPYAGEANLVLDSGRHSIKYNLNRSLNFVREFPYGK